MKSSIKKTILIAIGLSSCLFAQLNLHYPYGKIHLKSGFVLEGENLVIKDDAVSLTVLGNVQNYQLEDMETIFSGKKRGFNLMGTVIGVVVSLIAVGNLNSTIIEPLSTSVIVGISTGFLTPFLLSSVGVSKIRWKLLYSSE